MRPVRDCPYLAGSSTVLSLSARREAVVTVRLPALVILMLVVSVLVPGWLLLGALGVDQAQERRPSQTRTFLAEDSSGNGHHGLIQGSPGMGLPGRAGTAFSFLKGRSWVHVPPKAALNPGSRDFLVSAWVHFDDVPGPDETYDIVRKGVSYTREGEFKLEIVDPGDVRCTVKDSVRREARAAIEEVDVSDGEWHYVACARIGARLVVVADDVVVAEAALLGSVSNTMPLAIGSKYGWEDQSDGRVDEVRLVISSNPADQRARVPSRPALREMQSMPASGMWHLDEQQKAWTNRDQ